MVSSLESFPDCFDFTRAILVKDEIKNKIETLIHYPKMLCDLSIFRHISSKDKVTNSKKLGNKLLSLPISSEHQFKEINYICEKIIFF